MRRSSIRRVAEEGEEEETNGDDGLLRVQALLMLVAVGAIWMALSFAFTEEDQAMFRVLLLLLLILSIGLFIFGFPEPSNNSKRGGGGGGGGGASGGSGRRAEDRGGEEDRRGTKRRRSNNYSGGQGGGSRAGIMGLTMHGVLHFIQHEWSRYEMERSEWEMERAELQARISFLQGERRGQENLKGDLVRRIKMLEYCLKQERNNNYRLTHNGEEPPCYDEKEEDGAPDPNAPLDVDAYPLESANAVGWKQGRELLREYLEEIGYSETILDVRAFRFKNLLGTIPPGQWPANGNKDDGLAAMADKYKREGGTRGGSDSSSDHGGDMEPDLKEVFDEFNFLEKKMSFIMSFVICGFNWYGNHILVKSSQHLARKSERSALDYGHFAKKVCDYSDIRFLRNNSKAIMYVVNVTILVYQLGMCAVAILFISDNLAFLLPDVASDRHSEMIAMASIVLVFIIATNMFTEMRVISFFALISSVFFILGAVVIMQFCVRQPSHHAELPFVTNFTGVVTMSGMAMYAFEGQTMILPVENKLATPEDFLAPFGVLPTTMVVCGAFMTAIGFYGYTAFGDAVMPTITTNVPSNGLYATVSVFLMIQALLGHSIALYVVFDMFFNGFRRKFTNRFPNVSKFIVDKGFRLFWVFVTYLIAVLIPQLEIMIPLIGVTSGTLCALIYPPIFEMITFWTDWKESTNSKEDWHVSPSMQDLLKAQYKNEKQAKRQSSGSMSREGSKQGDLLPRAAKKDASNPSELEPIYTFRGHAGAVLSMDISPTGDRLFTGGVDDTVCCWAVPSIFCDPYDVYENFGEPLLRTFSAPSPDCVPTSVDFSSTEPQHLLAAYTGQKAMIIDIETGAVVLNFDFGEDATSGARITKILSHPTMPITIMAGDDRKIRYFDNSNGAQLHSAVAHVEGISSLDIDSNGLHLLSGMEKRVCLKEIPAHRKKHDSAVNTVAMHPSRPLIGSGGAEALAKVYMTGSRNWTGAQ